MSKNYSADNISPFLGDNFLLENGVAEELYHEHAKDQPIIDYHCHLPPDELAANKNFGNLTQIWLAGDHYKWRAMRTLGISEEFITGSADDQEKFYKWAETVPYTLRNPLYHWTHLELKRYFGIDTLVSPDTAEAIYTNCNTQLSESRFSTQGITKAMNVQVICTTDDPTDDLRHHIKLQEEGNVRVYPAFRPDRLILIDAPEFNLYIEKLGAVDSCTISTLDQLLATIERRVDFFHSIGCTISDHGLEKVYCTGASEAEANRILQKRLGGALVTEQEMEDYASVVLYNLGKMYSARNWVMQFHLGALRNTNRRMAREIGADSGFDSIGEWNQAPSLAAFLDLLDNENALPKTILYGLNPKEHPILATMIGNFNDGSIKGKMQFGSAWWYLDQKAGMEEQMNILSSMGLLSCFVGMLTDSRSFLSYPRHEYFRRILCNLIGKDVVNGELPHDMNWLSKIVKDICYNNAKRYFEF